MAEAVRVRRLFLDHFCSTSRIAENHRGLAGFLIAFLSPSEPQLARAITAPSNTGSIRFHQGLGFTVSEPAADYNGLDRAMVIFQRPLHQPSKVR